MFTASTAQKDFELCIFFLAGLWILVVLTWIFAVMYVIDEIFDVVSSVKPNSLWNESGVCLYDKSV